jgi:phosphoglycolate phosphatase-like HAD superfamily hydrolase
MKPLLLFDMDGTLIDLKKRPEYTGLENKHVPYMSLKAQMNKIATENGVPSDVVDGLDRMALIWNTVRRYAESNRFDNVDLLMRKINEPFMDHEREDHNISFLMPETIPGLKSLKDLGYKMGLVTTASRWSYDRISTSDEFGCFGRFFKRSITRDDVSYIKPDSEPLNRMKQIYGREDVVYIGDSDHDSLSAKATSCKFVLLNTRDYNEETIKALNPDGVIDTLLQLPAVLQKLNQ